MVKKHDFVRVADEILDEGKHPTYEAIRQRLGGGSFSDFTKLYAEWCVLREYRPRPTRQDLPEHLLGKLADVASEIWAFGRRNRALELQNECDRLTAECKALQALANERHALVIALEKSLALGQAIVRLDAEDMPLPVQDGKEVANWTSAKAHLADAAPSGEPAPTAPKPPKDDFWNQFMQRVLVILEEGPLSPTDILNALPESVYKQAMIKNKSFSSGRLADKMGRKSQLFTKLPGGLFCRRDRSLEHDPFSTHLDPGLPGQPNRRLGRATKEPPEAQGVLPSV